LPFQSTTIYAAYKKKFVKSIIKIDADYHIDTQFWASTINHSRIYHFFLEAMGVLGLRTLKTHGNFLYVAFGEHTPSVRCRLKDLVLYCRVLDDPCLAGFSRFSATTIECFRPILNAVRGVIMNPTNKVHYSL